MELLAPINLRLSERFRDPDYFHAFFDERTRDEIASQIRDLREQRDLTQAAFARDADMQQSAVSRIEQADYSGWTYKTLLKVARVLRARVKIEFVSQEDVINDYRKREATQHAAEIEESVIEVAKSGTDLYQHLSGEERNALTKAASLAARQNKNDNYLLGL